MIEHKCEYCGHAFEVVDDGQDTLCECPNCHNMSDVIVSGKTDTQEALPTRAWKSPGGGYVLSCLLGSLGLFYIGWVYFLYGVVVEGVASLCLYGCLVNEEVVGSLSELQELLLPFVIIAVWKGLFGLMGYGCAKSYNKKYGLLPPLPPCKKCGFNLDGIEEPVCPGCGMPIEK